MTLKKNGEEVPVDSNAPKEEMSQVKTDGKGTVQLDEQGNPINVEKGVSEQRKQKEDEAAQNRPDADRKADQKIEVDTMPDRSNPVILKSHKDKPNFERPEEMAKRVDTADVSNEGEKADRPAWGGGVHSKPAYYMTNVNGEKLLITTKQWEKYGERLKANGWTEPEFAKQLKLKAGNEAIPADVDWGKDKP